MSTEYAEAVRAGSREHVDPAEKILRDLTGRSGIAWASPFTPDGWPRLAVVEDDNKLQI